MAETIEYIERERRAGPGRPRLDQLRAWYTPPRLAVLMNVSRWEVERQFKHLFEQPDGPGTLRVIYLSRLKKAMPEAYESLLDMAAARARGEQPRRRAAPEDPSLFP